MREFFTTFLLALFLTVAGVANAQYSETIASGRPGQANGARTVGAGVIQLQAGTGYSTPSLEKDDINSYDADAVLRIGILERFEIGALWDYNHDRFLAGNDDVLEVSGFSSPAIRARVNLNEQDGGLLPTIAIQGGAVLPVGEGDYTSDEALPFARAMAGYNFLNRVNLTLNYRINWNDIQTSATHRYIFNLTFSLTDRLALMGEAYGDIYKTDHVSKFDYGLFYLINDDLQIDIYGGGHALNTDSDPFFINAGISWRVKL